MTKSARDYRELLLSGRWFHGLPSAFQERLISDAALRDVRAETYLFARGRMHVSPEILDDFAPWLAGTSRDSLLRTAPLSKVIRQLSATRTEYVERLRNSRERRTEGDDDLLCGPSPLSSHPIVLPYSRSRSFGVAPVPRLLPEYLYEPLTDRLYQAALRHDLTRAFNLLLEEYVGLVLSRYSPPTTRWLSEDEIRPPKNGRVVDWCGEFQSHLLLFEVKRAWLDPSARHQLNDSDWTSFDSTVRKAVEQGADFVRNVRSDVVPALRSSRQKKPVLVVVLGSDIRITPRSREMRRRLCELAHARAPGLGVVFLGIDQLHAILNRWQKRDFNWLPDALSKCATAEGDGLEEHLDHSASGPMWRAFTETITAARPVG